jgi:hypothetical protein
MIYSHLSICQVQEHRQHKKGRLYPIMIESISSHLLSFMISQKKLKCYKFKFFENMGWPGFQTGLKHEELCFFFFLSQYIAG